MDLVHFAHQGGKTESLRPTHALQVAAGLGKALQDGTAEGFTAHAGSVAEAARIVRERYRCRTVRKELRRVGLVGVEGVADNSPIRITCADPQILQQMAEAAQGG